MDSDRPAAPHGEAPLIPSEGEDESSTVRLVRATGSLIGKRCRLCGMRIYAGQLLIRPERNWWALQHAGCAATAQRKVIDPEQFPPRETGLRVAVTGGRNFADDRYLARTLNSLDISVLAHGGAAGADTLAARWAVKTGCPVRVYLPDWNLYGNRAGPLRNRLMLEHFAPGILVAFSGGRGTADCIRTAEEKRIPVWRTWLSETNPLPMSTTG